MIGAMAVKTMTSPIAVSMKKHVRPLPAGKKVHVRLANASSPNANRADIQTVIKTIASWIRLRTVAKKDIRARMKSLVGAVVRVQMENAYLNRVPDWMACT